jgi:hypothetical protein
MPLHLIAESYTVMFICVTSHSEHSLMLEETADNICSYCFDFKGYFDRYTWLLLVVMELRTPHVHGTLNGNHERRGSHLGRYLSESSYAWQFI